MSIVLKPWRFLWKYSLSYVVDVQITLWENIVDNWNYIIGTLFAIAFPIIKVFYLFAVFNTDYHSFSYLYSLVIADFFLLPIEMLIAFLIASNVMDDRLYYGIAVIMWIVLFLVEIFVFPLYASRYLTILQSILYFI